MTIDSAITRATRTTPQRIKVLHYRLDVAIRSPNYHLTSGGRTRSSNLLHALIIRRLVSVRPFSGGRHVTHHLTRIIGMVVRPVFNRANQTYSDAYYQGFGKESPKIDESALAPDGSSGSA